MNKILLTATGLLICLSSFSQSYFQQEVNYNIQVKLDDQKHELSAFTKIEYINNSPDQLDFIYFHLWPNAYSNTHTALAKQKKNTPGMSFKQLSMKQHQGYIDSLEFKVDGETIRWEYDPEHVDICKLYLNKSLNSGESIIITTPFHVKLPTGGISRLGHIGQSYQISQWYPKPAVYDREGWHQMPYLDMGEFYSEYGSFDVSITLPKNYRLGATGDLQNKEEIEWLDKVATETANIEEYDRKDTKFPPSDSEFKTLNFKQSNVHDFAWFADKRYHVLKGEVELPNTGRKVNSWVFYTNQQAHLWKDAIEYINDALYYYSLWYMDYPFNHCTAVYGGLGAGGGMEYPNITVIGDMKSAPLLEMVIMHEVGHNWFYGILGFNERDHGWMDEGLNSFSESRYILTKYGDKATITNILLGNEKPLAKFFSLQGEMYPKYHELAYQFVARNGSDQASSLTSNEFAMMNYGIGLYYKPARIFDYLKNYLGKDEFNRIMQDFFAKWQHKHPYPADLRSHFETMSGKDLSWVFDDLIQTTKINDYKVVRIKEDKVKVKNSGYIKAPVSITGVKDGKEVFTQWEEGFNGKKWIALNKPSETVDSLVIGYQHKMLDVYSKNNTIRTKGSFKKSAPLGIRFLGIVETVDYSKVNILPTMGWNNQNGFMLGALLYNAPIPKPRFEYQIMPMFAFGSTSLAGSAHLKYNIIPSCEGVRLIQIIASHRQYNATKNSIFDRTRLGMNIRFKTGRPALASESVLSLGLVHRNFIEDRFELHRVIAEVKYNYSIHKSRVPFSSEVKSYLGSDLLRLSGRVTSFIKYSNAKKTGIEIELFAGKSFLNDNGINENGFSANNNLDLTYDDVRLDRSLDGNDFYFNHQLDDSEGAFVSNFNLGANALPGDWLLSSKIAITPPVWNTNFIQFFFHYGAFDNNYTLSEDLINKPESSQFWETGVRLNIWKDFLKVYIPVATGGDFGDVTLNSKYRFVLNLKKLNPFDYLDGKPLDF